MSVSEQAAWVLGEGQARVLIGNWINFSSSGGWQRIKQGLERGPQAGLRERNYPSVFETCGRDMVGDRESDKEFLQVSRCQVPVPMVCRRLLFHLRAPWCPSSPSTRKPIGKDQSETIQPLTCSFLGDLTKDSCEVEEAKSICPQHIHLSHRLSQRFLLEGTAFSHQLAHLFLVLQGDLPANRSLMDTFTLGV